MFPDHAHHPDILKPKNRHQVLKIQISLLMIARWAKKLDSASLKWLLMVSDRLKYPELWKFLIAASQKYYPGCLPCLSETFGPKVQSNWSTTPWFIKNFKINLFWTRPFSSERERPSSSLKTANFDKSQSKCLNRQPTVWPMTPLNELMMKTAEIEPKIVFEPSRSWHLLSDKKIEFLTKIDLDFAMGWGKTGPNQMHHVIEHDQITKTGGDYFFKNFLFFWYLSWDMLLDWP